MPNGTAPVPIDEPRGPEDWFPYQSKEAFELADFLYSKNQMSGGGIDELLQIWSSTLSSNGLSPPFQDHNDLYDHIDATTVGDVPWQSFSCHYAGQVTENSPAWMSKHYSVHYRDPLAVVKEMLGNTTFKGQIDYVPYLDFGKNGKRKYHNFYSGNFPWSEAVSATHQRSFHRPLNILC